MTQPAAEWQSVVPDAAPAEAVPTQNDIISRLRRVRDMLLLAGDKVAAAELTVAIGELMTRRDRGLA